MFCVTKETKAEEVESEALSEVEADTEPEERCLWVLEDDTTVPTSTVIGKESILYWVLKHGFYHRQDYKFSIPLATPTMFTENGGRKLLAYSNLCWEYFRGRYENSDTSVYFYDV